MVISFKHKYIFVKNRKVGGSSFEKYLIDNLFDKKTDINTGSFHDGYHSNNIKLKNGGEVPGHLSILEIGKILKMDLVDMLKSFFIFSIERNPFDKCVSAYFFHKTNNSFLDFVKKNRLPCDWHKYTHENKIIGKVYLYEDYKNIFKDLNQNLFLKSNEKLYFKNLKKINYKSHYRPKWASYNKIVCQESKELIQKCFRNEIKTFHYNF